MTDRADTPVPGVVVILLDARSAVVSRSLTNESGEYRVIGNGPGTYRLRTLRIGFRPVLSTAIELAADQDITRRIALDDIPLALNAVTVTAKNVCSARTDTTVFSVWEQVRGALAAAKLTSASASYTARSVAYTRTLEAGRRGRVLSQFARSTEGRTTHPFKSIPAESLSKVGYVITDAQGMSTFVAPDIDVLLSDVFMDDHCLRVAREPDPKVVAVSFEPTYERTSMPSIRGTIRVDRQTSELRKLEFTYVNLTREQSVGDPGGEIEFVRLKNGAWMISGWQIRLPVVEVRQQMQGISGAITGGPKRDQFFVREVRVQGGELVFVRRRGGDTLWSRPARTLAGFVRDSVSGSAINGALVSVRGSNLADTSDMSGRFSFEDVMPGEYLVDVQTTTLAGAGLTHTFPFVFVDSTTRADVRLPSPDQILASYCGDATGGVIAGSVRLEGDSVPPYNVKVTAEWRIFYIENDVVTPVRRVAEARPNSRGDYRLCDVPPNTDLHLTAENARADAVPQKLRLTAGQRFLSHDIVLTLKPARP